MSNDGFIQGKVVDLHYEIGERDFEFAVIRLETADGAQKIFHAFKPQINFETGDVIRAISAPVRPNIRDSLSLVNADGVEHPSLFNVHNFGKVDVGTTRRSHYKFGEKIRGQVTEDLGSRFSMDWDFHFARLRLEDGSVIKVTLPDGCIPEGLWIEGTVGNSVFANDGDGQGSPGGLLSLGFGNLGGMPLLFNVHTVPAPRQNAGNQRAATACSSQRSWRSLFGNLFR